MKFPVLILEKDQFKDHYRNSGSGGNNFNKLDFQFIVDPIGGSDFKVTLLGYALKKKREPMHSAPIVLMTHSGGRIIEFSPPFKLGTLEIDKASLKNDIGIGEPNHETFTFLRFEAAMENGYIIYNIFKDNNKGLAAKAANPCPPAPQL